jgi:MinD superfamily P-loop ATPase
MKELVVISGKGGTGKTSITASFAYLAGSVVLADCDVDAADLHLVTGAELIQSKPFVSGHQAQVRPQDCTACGLCESLCRFSAVTIEAKAGAKARVNPSLCQGCKVCVQVCPAQAIDFLPRLCGDSFVSKTRLGDMSHARLHAGADNSGKLVALVRRTAKEMALAQDVPWLIVDGPPGIGCPVIASITGADAVLLVTEPSLSAKHDLERVAKLCHHFKIPATCLINRCDIHADTARDLEEKMTALGVPIIGRIPYDPGFNRAQLAGLSLMEAEPHGESSKALEQAWEKLKALLMWSPVTSYKL